MLLLVIVEAWVGALFLAFLLTPVTKLLDGRPVRSWQFEVRYAILRYQVLVSLPLVPLLRRLDPKGWAEVDELVRVERLHTAHNREVAEHYRAQTKRYKKLNKQLRKRVASRR